MFKMHQTMNADSSVRDILDHSNLYEEPYAVCSSCGSVELLPTDSCSTCWKDTLIVSGEQPTRH